MSYIAAEDVAKAKEMEKYITDERTGLKYELVGDYYPVSYTHLTLPTTSRV